MLELHTHIQYVKGIGPRVASLLSLKGIETVEDLLYYLPYRYEDRLNPRGVAELREGEMATVIAEVRGAALLRTRRMPIFEMTVGEGRSSIKCIWFNGTYLKDIFKRGQLVAFYGKVERGNYGRGPLQIRQPQYEILAEPEELQQSTAEGLSTEDLSSETLEVGRIVPIYETAAERRLTSRWFRKILWTTLQDLQPRLPDGLPGSIIRRLSLVDRRTAFQTAHFPDAGTSFVQLQAMQTPGQRRLIFEELFFLEVGLELKRRRMRAVAGVTFSTDEKIRAAIKKILPFHPTAAQKRVLGEIVEDMRKPVPMRRLLQGDVGSGKTIVALQAAVVAIENGCQVALMAPTEILATQHYLSARRLLEPHGYRVVLLTGSLEEERKRGTRRHIAQGNAQLVIGTHALIEESVEFDKLGLVIVDEQHRFGVMQRFRLMKKPNDAEPDVLVMTATPIPRTLALTLYGDLDTSTLDELPPGRTPIVTRRIADERIDEVWAFVRKQVALGHQAYVVYPVIEGKKDDQAELDLPRDVSAYDAEAKTKTKGGAKTKAKKFALPSSELELKAATEMYEELRTKTFSDLRVGLLHGRLSPDEKEIVMRRFQRGEIDVLVATTVIEVGVDVPNATIMVVEHAERFGLAQLHQLRGRIGRGDAKSFCVLVTSGRVSSEGDQRLNAMVRTQNGFDIAELDLQLRGPGEFFGTRQAGMPNFRVANLIRDRELLEAAKLEAAALVAGTDPEITKEETAAVMHNLRSHWQRRYGLVEVG